MNPWRIIGWIVLAAIVWLLARPFFEGYSGYQARAQGDYTASPAATRPRDALPASQSVAIESFTCEYDRYGWTSARLTVRNEGPETLRFAQAHFRLDDEVFGRYLTPTEVPPGSIASASKGVQRRANCQLMTIQGRRGETVVINQ